jgi:asparagine synthase (glutamine-hydrolysing)
MCGILGGINTQFDDLSLERLGHRGPDQSRLAIEQLEGVGVITLGQTRLNVVDRHDVDLPVRIGKCTILFNGEVYNSLELRRELEGCGREFETNTDTEVALAAYLEWGAECLNRFNGMFALVIWDGERFFCARDRMGQKPLFFRTGARSFEFSSEVKAFEDLEFVSRDVFDLFEFCFNEHTLFRDVFSLKLAVDTFVELLEDAVRLRMRADVPVGLFLSGGIDSALVARFSGVEEAFTCQFAEFTDTINEEQYARDLASRLGIRLDVVSPTREEFFRDLPALAYHLEMPTGSFSVFPLFCLSRATRAAGYKVTLSGEGSDELFAGYARNEFLVSDRLEGDEVKQQHYRSMLARYRGSELDRFCRMASRSGLAGAALMKERLGEYWSDRKSMLENICYVESRIFLQPLLQMADRMTMAHGLEGRCPFLDYRMIEFAFSLDDSLRHRDGTGKWIVHQAATKVLPSGAAVLKRGVKHGLATPVNLWTQGRHSFDRRYWNAIMTAECVKSLLGGARAG